MNQNENGLVIINQIVKKLTKEKNVIQVRKVLMNELTRLMPYDFAVFDICSVSNERVTLVEPVVKSKYDSVFERRFLYDYDTKYAGMSYSRWIHNEKRTLILRDSDILKDYLRKEARFYKEYLQAYGFEYVLNCEFVNNGTNVASLTLLRERESKDFSDSEVYYMELLAPAVIHALKDHYVLEQNIQNSDFLDAFGLTKREKEVINLVYESNSNKEIGDQLFISENTVKKHLYNIFNKMQIKNREKLISYLHSKQYREY